MPWADIAGDHMAADVDALYPNLSNVAQSHGTALNKLAESANASKHTYLKLADCCWLVRNEKPKYGNANHFNYLATLDEYAKRPDRTYSEIWKSLQKGGPSKFLDTLVEAVWAIHFTNKGLAVSLDVPINPSSQSSKDVDFVITLKGKEWWLDALSVGPKQLKAPPIVCDWPPQLGCQSIESAVLKLANKAKEKYRDKFSEAVRSGLLDGSSAGILLCVMKQHNPLVCAFIEGVTVETPANFFSDKPGLDFVLIHTVGARDGQDILQPISLYCWWRKGINKSYFEGNLA